MLPKVDICYRLASLSKVGEGWHLKCDPCYISNLNLRVDNHTAQSWAMVITHRNHPNPSEA